MIVPDREDAAARKAPEAFGGGSISGCNVMSAETQDRVSSNYVKHLQQRAQDLRAQLKRCLANAEANRNNGHAMDNFLVQAARLRKQIATAERRLEACKAREQQTAEISS